MRRSDVAAATGFAVLFAGYLALWVCLLAERGQAPKIWLLTGGAAISLVLTALVARLAPRPTVRAATLIVVAGVLLQIVAIAADARTSTDAYRYVWDGLVQFHGTDPYRYAPQDPHLTHLRTGYLFGHGAPCAAPIPHGCTAINRPSVRTVYPPVAQLGFDAVRLVSFGGHGGIRAFQVAGGVGATAVSALLARRAIRRGEPLWPVALWAFSPVVVSEFGNNGHIDWLAVLLSFAALAAGARGRAGRAGLWLGAAVLTKIYPGLLAPSLLRRRPVAVVGAAVALGVVTYLPHVLAVGTSVIGYLPGYLNEEGISSGTQFLLIGAAVNGDAATAVAAVLIVALAAAVAWRTDPDAPERTAVVMVGGTFLITTPHYGWYAALLIMLVALTRRLEWLPVALASSFIYIVVDQAPRAFTHPQVDLRREIYVTAVVTAVLVAAWRYGPLATLVRSGRRRAGTVRRATVPGTDSA